MNSGARPIALSVERACKSFRTLGRRTDGLFAKHTTVTAVDDLSFTVSQGETVGLLGRNGAGKTTLLRMMTGSTRPTSGAVLASSSPRLVSITGYDEASLSLLENAEIVHRAAGLKGRDARLGAKKLLLEAGLEDKANLPAKTLSTGMKARFDFFLRTVNQPRILLFDEMLSVTDRFFQESAEAKINQLLSEGRTTIISSHDLATVERLCNRVLVLDKGCLVFDGETSPGVNFYRRIRTNAA